MPTDFFENQDRARRKTGLLVAYFALAVVLIVAGVYFVVAGALQMAADQSETRRPGARPVETTGPTWWNPELFLWIAGGTVGIIALGSLYKTASLSAGGASVAELLGGRRVPPDTTDLAEQRLMNVVEEMAIASGTPVPPVYVLEDETGINAFAAGFAPGDAVVAVTRGTLNYLDREELQGVIAHEFSHVVNGDMRINIRLIGILHGILLIAMIGYVIVRSMAYSSVSRSRSNRKGGGGGLILVGVGLIVIGYVGVFFGKLIKAAVSRQREYLADASAVQFTRNPSGIAGALKKIGGISRGARIENAHAEEASHLFFGDGVGALFNALSTHPPLEERIRRLDPSFDGTFPKVRPVQESAEKRRKPQRKRRPAEVPFPGARGPQAGGARMPLDPLTAVLQVGTLGAGHLAYAAALLESLPDPLHAAARNPFGARAVIYALLLDADDEIRKSQLERLAEHAEPAAYEETRRLVGLSERLSPEARLPLVELTFPALRTLSESQYRGFRENVDTLVKADRKIQLFEYVLQRMLLRHLDGQFFKRRRPVVQYYALRGLLPDCVCLLSTLAYMGHSDPDEAVRAFDEGARLLTGGEPRLQIAARDECGLKTVDAALDKLVAAAPQIKKKVLTAATACVATDGRVTVTEAELLRAVADSLDCPMPPLTAGQEIEAPRAEEVAK